MLRSRFLGICVAIMLVVGGCSTGSTYVRMGPPTSAPTLRVNGELVAATRENYFKFLGAPTFVVEREGTQICIWRDHDFFPGLAREEHIDWIMTFDTDGNFKPTDLDAYYGFCRSCGCDLRSNQTKACPDCGRLTDAVPVPSG